MQVSITTSTIFNWQLSTIKSALTRMPRWNMHTIDSTIDSKSDIYDRLFDFESG